MWTCTCAGRFGLGFAFQTGVYAEERHGGAQGGLLLKHAVRHLFTICGTSGAGKTYTMQVMALRMRMRGIQCFILAPLKGHEFKRLASMLRNGMVERRAASC